MKLHLSKTFFVPTLAIIFLLSLSSCGKDYDLVSEYVIRDATQKIQLNHIEHNDTLGVAVVNAVTEDNVKKK
ncbi:hypothetical protein [Maribacter hydrothermalis]|uniref:Uncharacterized protein n=1 Tax=Maribacter hydrothermalis TaxID=1836467 RepID=A0A1B7ZCB5_9FLAO|nr:hypothetical protein [Maribacter hydrothermalis]APQ18026.1 hypothetical protein BTR34_12100 [Maribacter hydrothermalis]OBR40568.1 hypothetical protein A9200_15760 [Maribacter hydrothermalis]